MTATRIAIVGSRPPTVRTDEALDEFDCLVNDARRFVLDLPRRVQIITGGAQGIDGLATLDAGNVLEILPNYATHGKAAPLVRNQQIVDAADEIHAWPSSWSRGTWDTVNKARKAGKPCFVHEPWKERQR